MVEKKAKVVDKWKMKSWYSIIAPEYFEGREIGQLVSSDEANLKDRVMKIGRVEIGARTTIGSRSTILYDTHIGDSVNLGPLTLVAKGERLPAGTRWEGSPAAPR